MALTHQGQIAAANANANDRVNLRDPEVLAYVKELTQRVIAVWEDTPDDHRAGIERALFNVGVERRGSSWAYQLNGRTFLIK